MFFLKILSAHLIPGIYIYLRVYRLFVPKRWKIIFSLFFLVLLAAFPATEMIGQKDAGDLLSPLLKIGHYTMPFLLYLLLLLLAFDIFLLFNLVFKWLPKGFLINAKFKKNGLITAVALPIKVVLYGIINFSWIRVSDYSSEVPAGSSGSQNITVDFVSDCILVI